MQGPHPSGRWRTSLIEGMAGAERQVPPFARRGIFCSVCAWCRRKRGLSPEELSDKSPVNFGIGPWAAFVHPTPRRNGRSSERRAATGASRHRERGDARSDEGRAGQLAAPPHSARPGLVGDEGGRGDDCSEPRGRPLSISYHAGTTAKMKTPCATEGLEKKRGHFSSAGQAVSAVALRRPVETQPFNRRRHRRRGDSELPSDTPERPPVGEAAAGALEPAPRRPSRRRLCHDFQDATASTAGSTLVRARDALVGRRRHDRAPVIVVGTARSLRIRLTPLSESPPGHPFSPERLVCGGGDPATARTGRLAI